MKIKWDLKIGKALGIALVTLSVFTFALNRVYRDRYHPEWGSGLVKILVGLEWKWYDLRFQAKAQEHSPDVLVAKIDDSSLERFGRWPWSRALYSKILESLYDMGAETVGFDAVFSEPEYNRDYLKSTLQQSVTLDAAPLSEELNLSTAQIEGLAENLPKIGDRIFATGVNANPRTVLGYIWQGLSECSVYDPTSEKSKEISDIPLNVEQAKQRGLVHVDTLVDNLGAVQNQSISLDSVPMTVKMGFPLYACPVSNRSDLAAKARFQGYFNAIPDADGLYRRLPLVLAFSAEKIPKSQADFLPSEWLTQATFFPSLTIQMLLAFFNPNGAAHNIKPNIKTRIENNELVIESIAIPREGAPDLVIPTLADGSVLINFLGSQSTRPQAIGDFSLAEVPFREDPAQVPPSDFSSPDFRKLYNIENEIVKPLKKKLVAIGPTAMGVYDLRPNPTQGDAPGVYLHAAVLARVMQLANTGQSQVSIRYLNWVNSAWIIWILGISLAFILAYSTAFKGAVAVFVTIGLVSLSDYILFNRFQVAMFFMTSMIALGATSVFILAFKYFTEERAGAFLKGTFEKFVSPELVKQMVQNPKLVSLSGEKKELSVLFSDIRGFTGISEKLKADELARFMNGYLTPMTDVVLANRGTVDKYMGDAIMVIFGAPVDYKNHAEKAVDTALEMLKKLGELKIVWREQHLPPLDIGIGINTGEMSVGNMGSDRIMAYTVMGDAVNLASRLEGINKEYHTHIVVSEYTRRQLGPEYTVRELDRVKVKGKLEPVTIFEVRGKGKLTKVDSELVSRFEAALQLYYRSAFAEALGIFEELSTLDETSKVYVERCQMWMESPPSTGWDGSWTMKSK